MFSGSQFNLVNFPLCWTAYGTARVFCRKQETVENLSFVEICTIVILLVFAGLVQQQCLVSTTRNYSSTYIYTKYLQ